MAAIHADPSVRRQRLVAAACVAALHVAMGLALISGFGVTIAEAVSGNLKAFTVSAVSPEPVQRAERAPVVQEQSKAAPAEPEAAAAPTNLPKSHVPLVVPPPVVPLPPVPPVLSAPVQGDGLQSEAGAAAAIGPGSGAGSAGFGTGNGARGSGTGAGGVAVHAERVKGRIKASDYPKGAYEAHMGGTVFVRLLVGADGRVSDCTIDESSGRDDLDAATCHIILERYRYRPARDASGRPVPEVVHMAQVWETGRRW